MACEHHPNNQEKSFDSGRELSLNDQDISRAKSSSASSLATSPSFRATGPQNDDQDDQHQKVSYILRTLNMTNLDTKEYLPSPYTSQSPFSDLNDATFSTSPLNRKEPTKFTLLQQHFLSLTSQSLSLFLPLIQLHLPFRAWVPFLV